MKNILKKGLKAVMVMLMTWSMLFSSSSIVNNANAATITYMEERKTTWIQYQSITSKTGVVHNSGNCFYIMSTSEPTSAGKYLYCIDFGVSLPDNTTMSSSTSASSLFKGTSVGGTTADEKMKLVSLIAGRSDIPMEYEANHSMDAKEKIRYLVGRTLIWEVTEGERDANFNLASSDGTWTHVKDMWTFSSTTNDSGYTYTSSELKEYFNEIYDSWVTQIQNEIKIENNIPSFTSTSKSSADTVVLKYDSSTGTYSTTLTDNNGVLSLYDDNIEYSNSSVSSSRSENKITIKSASAIDKDSSATITFNADRTIEKGSILGYVSGNYQKVISIGSPSSASRTTYLKVYTEVGSLQIAKKDSNGNYVADTSFTISYNSDMSSPIGTYTTGSDGTVTIDNLHIGTIYVQEISVPDNLVLDSNIYSVSVISNETVTYTATNDIKQGKLQVSKIGSDGSSGVQDGLEGVEFTIKLYSDVQNLGWDEATTYDVLITDSTGRATSVDLPYGVYLVRETYTPENYSASGDFFVTIDEDEEIEYRVVNNSPFKAWLKLIKTDEDGDEVTLSNATFKLKDSNGNYVQQKSGWTYIDTWTTDEDGIVYLDNMVASGTYYVEEITTPDGFLLADAIKVDITSTNDSITFDKDNDPIITVEIVDKKPTGKIVLNKNTELTEDIMKKGIKFQLTANSDIIDPTDGSIIYSKGDIVTKDYEDGIYEIDENGFIQIADLPLGTEGASYLLTEVETQDGYALLEEPIQFDFTIHNNTTKVYEVIKSANNKLTETYFRKSDVGGNEVEGAQMVLTDNTTDTVIDEWISTTEEHLVKGLIYGHEYTLSETSAPDGYVVSTDVTFIYSTEIEKVTMTDKQVFISKEDIAGEELEGAKIHVIDEDGNIVDEWTSTNEQHAITGLEEGKTYTLHEETAPNGYYLANDIEFTVSDDKENEYYIIVDEKILTDIEVVKIDSSTGKVITGLDFAFTLYADKECTKEITTVNSNTENGTVTFEDLEYGTYYILETQAPKGYQLSDEVIEVVINDDLEHVGDVYTLKYENTSTPIITVITDDNTPIEALWWTTFVVSISGVYLSYKKKKYLNNMVD